MQWSCLVEKVYLFFEFGSSNCVRAKQTWSSSAHRKHKQCFFLSFCCWKWSSRRRFLLVSFVSMEVWPRNLRMPSSDSKVLQENHSHGIDMQVRSHFNENGINLLRERESFCGTLKMKKGKNWRRSFWLFLNFRRRFALVCQLVERWSQWKCITIGNLFDPDVIRRPRHRRQRWWCWWWELPEPGTASRTSQRKRAKKRKIKDCISFHFFFFFLLRRSIDECVLVEYTIVTQCGNENDFCFVALLA